MLLMLCVDIYFGRYVFRFKWIKIFEDFDLRKGNFQKNEGKADALDLAEGSRPVIVMASVQVTTGVLDQGMCSKG